MKIISRTYFVMKPTNRLSVLWLSCLYILAACGGGGGTGDISSASSSSGSTNPTYTVSGIVTPSIGMLMDSDVNDPSVTNVSNNTFVTAQRIGNPSTIGGHVNVAGAGSVGQTKSAGDRSDYFKIDLLSGQSVRLSVSDIVAGDLDLYLYDSNGLNVDSSLGTGKDESVTAQTSGSYYVEVYAYEGESNYEMATGITGASVGNSLSLSDNFVSDEVIIKLKDTLTIQSNSAEAAATSLGLELVSGATSRPMLMKLPATAEGMVKMTAALNIEGPDEDRAKIFETLSPEMQQKWQTIRAIKALRKRADVATVDPNYIRYPSTLPNDPAYKYQWHYSLINLPQAWDITTGSTDVIVAVVDTGVLLNHPDLAGKLVSGYDFISDAARARDGNGLDSNPNDSGDLGNGGSSSFHGTHVCGTIAALSNNTTGVAGIGWGVKAMPIRVLGKGGGTDYDIMQGIKYAAGLPNDSATVPARKADVINLSLGGPGYSQTVQDAYTAVRNSGVIIIAAAGNENSTSPSYPASYAGVVSVGAVELNKNRAPYSNYGVNLDVAAPGGDMSKDLNGDGYPDGVLSTLGDDSDGATVKFIYGFYQGTSMASPHVAGVVALMKSVDPNLTPTKFDTWLAAGELTMDIGVAGRDDYFGYGLIDTNKAVLKAKADAGSPVASNPVLSVTPNVLNFGYSDTTGILSVINAGTGSLSISIPTSNANWLSIVSENINSSTKLGSYRVAVSRVGLVTGVYTGQLTFTPSTGVPVKVTVIMQVNNNPLISNAGFLYFLLIDSSTKSVVKQVSMASTAGTYAYQFNNVPAGSYTIQTGSDSNYDGYICDPGESCGKYISLDQPVNISVGGNLAALNFGVSFTGQIQSQASSVFTPAEPVRLLKKFR